MKVACRTEPMFSKADGWLGSSLGRQPLFNGSWSRIIVFSRETSMPGSQVVEP